MTRFEQSLIDECSSAVQEYIEYLEDVEEHYDKVMEVIEDLPVDIDEMIGED